MAVYLWSVAATLLAFAPLYAQAYASLQGRVLDTSEALVPKATIRVRSDFTGFDYSVRADDEGRFHIAAIPSGTYQVTVSADGFRPEVIQQLKFEVGRALVRDFRLEAGDQSGAVVVRDRLLYHASTRDRRARHQHRRQSRGDGRVPGQRGDVGQLDVQPRVRPRVGGRS
jgi:hypothetical protein